MTFMRAAIADKPDEQFLGDDQSDQLMKAQATPPTNGQPGRLASAKPAQPVTTGSAGPAKTAVQTGTKPEAKLTEATDVTPRVKPARSAQPITANPRGILKPAIDSPR
jgi:hypothetical protein